MARLRDRDERIHDLDASHLLGRSRAVSTVLASADVSGQHLVISWTGSEWTVRDLASRNGTWLDGRRLGPGEVAALTPGAVLLVGSPAERFTVVDLDPPAARATSGDLVIRGGSELLALPSAAEPLALYELDPVDGWTLRVDEVLRHAQSGETIEVGGRAWRVSLPEALVKTADARADDAPPEPLALRFRVSGDEEYVELTAVLRGAPRTLPARAHHEILLALARARLEEADRSEAEQGWVYTSELMRMMRLTSNQLYVGMHRARKEFEVFGADTRALVERRATTHQVRLGVRVLSIDAF